MPSIYKISSGKWRAQVRHNGKTSSKNFLSKSAAREWAHKEESFIADNSYQAKSLKFSDILDRYVREVSINKITYKRESKRAEFLKTFHLSQMYLSEITPKHINDFRVERMANVKSSTVARDFSFIGAVFEAARRNWELIKINPVHDAVKPPPSKPRKARITQEQIEAITEALGYTETSEVKTVYHQVAIAFLLAIETAMRQSEITGIKWVNVSERSILLQKTKNGESRLVPLSLRAVELINKLPRNREKLFTVSSASLSSIFRKVRRRLGFHDIRFHDSRREATSRLAKKFDVMMLAKITGHKDLKMLLNVYYAPELDDFITRLDN